MQADPLKRDALRDAHGIKAVEMEGSGVADASWVANVGYLVVRGTCDYCNSAKCNDWHYYAALVAAAYTRTVIEYLHPTTRPDAAVAMESLRSQVILSQNKDSPQRDIGQVASATNVEGTAAKYPPGAESALPIENAASLNAAKALTTSAETAGVGDGVVPSSELTQRIATELQVRSVVIVETDSVRVYTKKIDALLKEFRVSETAPLAAELEKQLRLRPRTGHDVRAGWIALAQIESQLQLTNRQAGHPIDINRLKMLRWEADNVTD